MSSNSYVLVDFYNLLFRSAHTAGKTSNIDDKVGLMMHKLLNSLYFIDKLFEPTSIVICVDSGSWRKKIYPEYKLNRVTARLKKTPKEQEEDQQILDAAREFYAFFKFKTWLPTIKCEEAEADDVISTFIQGRPNDQHIIMSTDGDFNQLVRSNVMLYNPTSKEYHTNVGTFDEKTNPVIDKKTGKQKTLGDPEWGLFVKCIRGDSGDNIKSAYPRVRTVGTKNKTGLKEAFEDRLYQGVNWHNIMEHEWKDGFDNKHRVKDMYLFNKQLIDLSMIPNDIQYKINLEIDEQLIKNKQVKASNIGFDFMKFCSKWELYAILEKSTNYVNLLTKSLKSV